MSVGETTGLTATISPSNAENQKVLWSTSDANVVMVKDGAVSAIAPGKAVVTVKTDDGGKTAECTVIVKGTNEGDGSGEGEENKDDKKWPVSVLTTVTATTIQFDITLDANAISEYQETGLIFSLVDDLDVDAEGVRIFQINRDSCSKVFTGLTYNTKYYYTTYLKKGNFYLYGEKKELTTSNVQFDLSVVSTTTNSAKITGKVEGLSESDKSMIEIGMIYSYSAGDIGKTSKLTATKIPSDNIVSFDLTDLTSGKTYSYYSYVTQGNGYVYGERKSFTTTSTTVVTIAEFLANGGPAIEGIVISNKELNNLTSKKSMYIQDETAGLQFYLSSENHTFSFGDKVRVDISGVSAGKYGGAVQVSDLDIDKITEISSGNTVTPKTVTISDFLANKYEGQYIAIEGVQVAGADLDKTFVMGGAHTSINMEDANNNYFVVFSSKYATFGNQIVPQGSGTIKGISSIYNGNMQIIFTQNSDFANLTGERFSSDADLDLSSSGSANCYIVSKSGLYKFKAAKGNSSKSVGAVASVDVLWESSETDDAPKIGDLVNSVYYKNGYIFFWTADTFKEGNALIVAKDASGKILWSWHIWFTDQPQGQKYYNNAGTMMDRNLGATSTGEDGLFYQWGRTDPFLGTMKVIGVDGWIELPQSTITWPSAVASDESTGTMAYATANPTTFITGDDWFYGSGGSTTLWTTSDKSKSIYDPCPAGWRIPNGGNDGVWSKALGNQDGYSDNYNFGTYVTKYPIPGYIYCHNGIRTSVDEKCFYWSATSGDRESGTFKFGCAYSLNIIRLCEKDTCFNEHAYRANGLSVRCIKE